MKLIGNCCNFLRNLKIRYMHLHILTYINACTLYINKYSFKMTKTLDFFLHAEIASFPSMLILKSFLESPCWFSFPGWYIRGVFISSPVFCERPVRCRGLTASSPRAPGQICKLPAGQTVRMLKYVSILGCKQTVYSWTWSISIRNSVLPGPSGESRVAQRFTLSCLDV